MSFGEGVFHLLQPSNTLFTLTLLGVLAGLAGFRRALWLSLAGLVVMALFAVVPVGVWLSGTIEARVERQDVTGPLDGIVVLGGFVNTRLSAETGTVQLNESAERLVEGAMLARQFAGADVILTDGAPPDGRPGAEVARDVMVALGVAEERIVVEGRSRSTWDNAVMSAELVEPQPGERYALVTSAWHMPRALATFVAAGWPPMVAVPVDRTASASTRGWVAGPMQLSEGLKRVDVAAREWMALAYYRWRGITDRLLPPVPREGAQGR